MSERGAIFSDCRRYRYRLWRRWADGDACAFLMLNPSTADDVVNDPTVERCERRARDWGYGRLDVVNLFAYRSTDPSALREQSDPVGPDNFEHIVAATKQSRIVVCAWGKHGSILNMGPVVLGSLRQFHPGKAHALKLNGDGSPAHPLYLPYALAPFSIESPDAAGTGEGR